MLTSKEVADMFHISASTIRYYEKIGIIPPIKRDEKGYRIYNNSALSGKTLESRLVKIHYFRESKRITIKENYFENTLLNETWTDFI